MTERLMALLRGALHFGRGLIAAAVAMAARWRGDAAYRERAFGIAAFAGIFAFTIVSMDYLITAGPEWNPGAPAPVAQAQRAERALATSLPIENIAPAPAAVAEAEIVVAVLTADDLLGGPEEFFAAFAPDAGGVGQLAAYSSDGAAKPQRASLGTGAAFSAPAGKHKAPAIAATASETASLW